MSTLPSPLGEQPSQVPPGPVFTSSFLSPKKVVLALIKVGIAKSKEPAWIQFMLAFVAGNYAAFGGLLVECIGGGFLGPNGWATNNPAITQLVIGFFFPVALILIVVTGTELFTGNCMYLTVAFAQRKITLRSLLSNWFFVYFGNFAGALFVTYFLSYHTNLIGQSDTRKELAQAIAEHKCALEWQEALLRGIGCNWLVCLAMFLGLAGDHLIDKIVALWWPVFAFAAIGFEHCIANMFFIPNGILHDANITWGDFIGKNLVPVTIGNIIGGALFVGIVEWILYRNHFSHEVAAINTEPGRERKTSVGKQITAPQLKAQNNRTPAPAPGATAGQTDDKLL
eukprot:c2190_g1_i2.p1 GENE.c2190_g1_i2~~c2190_g1_i2.p1  ORF type:complete len:340 (-),score=62.52 c2190_g1_i2:38-1057(-)